jgi:hypothetical protein
MTQREPSVATQTDSKDGHPAFLNDRQRAEVSLAVTKDSGLSAKAEISNGGLLSIAVLVSSILLSTAVLVHVATRDAARRRLW